MTKPCIRCGHPHHEKTGTCEACKVIVGGMNHHYSNTPVQSQRESQIDEAVAEYRAERDDVGAGGWIE